MFISLEKFEVAAHELEYLNEFTMACVDLLIMLDIHDAAVEAVPQSRSAVVADEPALRYVSMNIQAHASK